MKKKMKPIDPEAIKSALKDEAENLPDIGKGKTEDQKQERQINRVEEDPDKKDQSKTIQFPKYVWKQLKNFSDDDEEPLRLQMLRVFKAAGLKIDQDDLIDRRKGKK